MSNALIILLIFLYFLDGLKIIVQIPYSKFILGLPILNDEDDISLGAEIASLYLITIIN